jgi:hypothetical protein
MSGGHFDDERPLTSTWSVATVGATTNSTHPYDRVHAQVIAPPQRRATRRQVAQNGASFVIHPAFHRVAHLRPINGQGRDAARVDMNLDGFERAEAGHQNVSNTNKRLSYYIGWRDFS